MYDLINFCYSITNSKINNHEHTILLDDAEHKSLTSSGSWLISMNYLNYHELS